MDFHAKHKQFLQYFMRERMVLEEDCKKISNVLFPENNFNDIIEVLNLKITPLEFKINKVVCEQNGKTWYVFIATFIDDFNIKQDPIKLEFIKLVDYILAAGGSVKYDNILNYSSNSDSLMNFFKNNYLMMDDNQNVFLSPLAISELEGYLANKYKDKRCMICMSIVGNGIKCQSCNMFAHGYCLTTYFKNIGITKCPKCSKQLLFNE